jgi:DNA repair exonuclease SbcCD nuclease subunit
MSVIFDTLAYARRMEQVGFTREQAEALAEEQAKLIDERLATKADTAAIRADIEAHRLTTTRDIETLRLATTRDIERLRTELKNDMELLKRDLTIRLGGLITGSVAVTIAVLGFLIHH